MNRTVMLRAVSGLALLLLACEREIPPGIEPSTISGYQIEGVVSDALGNPVRGVPIGLYYDYVFEDRNPPPSKVYEVVDPNKIIRVQVFDWSERFVRQIFEGRAPVGPLTIPWDLRDAGGNLAPSGVYSVRYIVDGEVQKSYPVTISGAITASTDSFGHYVITNENLPVGFYPVPLYSADSTEFLGNCSITSYVLLEFHVEPRRIVGLVLEKDQIKRLDLKV